LRNPDQRAEQRACGGGEAGLEAVIQGNDKKRLEASEDGARIRAPEFILGA